ncbi:hypothetical protein GX51_07218 [Blastomyces parvus]|uniref:Uncharacterized protein n=1 Tax=Blastomyces parvus TaxID=2060905 RepID=A0A2B7WMB0_9EURO|nr:hypothetical protein GX51_07218 [Blastomyces parvus]
MSPFITGNDPELELRPTFIIKPPEKIQELREVKWAIIVRFDMRDAWRNFENRKIKELATILTIFNDKTVFQQFSTTTFTILPEHPYHIWVVFKRVYFTETGNFDVYATGEFTFEDGFQVPQWTDNSDDIPMTVTDGHSDQKWFDNEIDPLGFTLLAKDLGHQRLGITNNEFFNATAGRLYPNETGAGR